MKRFIGTVVSVSDPEKAGRVQIRIYGDHDDTVNIPDSSLPWARCSYPVTNPVSGGVAGATTGLVVGSIVHGHYWDEHYQIPVVEGTLGRSSSSSTTKGDFPLANAGSDTNDVTGTNLQSTAAATLKALSSPSIGSVPYAGQTVTTLITQIGGNSIGTIMSTLTATLGAVNEVVAAVANADSVTDATDAINGFAATSTDTGSQYTTINSVVGSIAARLAKQPITSTADALNRVNGSSFVMSTSMATIESTLAALKSL